MSDYQEIWDVSIGLQSDSPEDRVCAKIRIFGLGLDIPVVENLSEKILKVAQETPEKFDMESWELERECGTARCIAGWAVEFAGEAGKRLLNTVRSEYEVAANFIFAMSEPELLTLPYYYQDNDEAIEELQDRVERLKNGNNG